MFNLKATGLMRVLGRVSPRNELQKVPLFKVNAANAHDTEDKLHQIFSHFQVQNLVGIDPSEFQRSVNARIGTTALGVKQFDEKELNKQRDLSIKFHWGHNHDFGSFLVDGRMGKRHLELLSDFTQMFPVSIESFNGQDVLDIGCWTGGTTLLLLALGSRVQALEEVPMYADTTRYLINAFGLSDRASVHGRSLYACNCSEFYKQFDRVYFPGVIYHLSDPVLALRILYNTLRFGGDILVESAGIRQPDSLCLFEGNAIYHSGTKQELSRGGWNWFLPSPLALERMLLEAGFEEVKTMWHVGRQRVFGYGRKKSENGICRAGLSVPDIA